MKINECIKVNLSCLIVQDVCLCVWFLFYFKTAESQLNVRIRRRCLDNINKRCKSVLHVMASQCVIQCKHLHKFHTACYVTIMSLLSCGY